MGYTTQLPQEGKKNTESQRHERKKNEDNGVITNTGAWKLEGGGTRVRNGLDVFVGFSALVIFVREGKKKRKY